MLPSTANSIVGLLCLRADRGDRTQQWIEALNNGAASYFEKVYVQGKHAKVMKRRVKWINVLRNSSSEIMMESLLNHIENQTVILGLGNIGGMGRNLIEYWNKIGEPYGV